MKKITDRIIIDARPAGYPVNRAFTDRVMSAVASTEILSQHVRKMSVNKKETLIMRLRHLPRLATIAVAIGTLAVLAGTAYAIVHTITSRAPVSITESGENEFGRQQLKVSFDGCKTQKDEGTTYELKRGSNLTLEDGARVLQAHCETDSIREWLSKDMQIKDDPATFPVAGLSLWTDKIQAITNSNLQLKNRDLPLRSDTRVVESGKVVDKNNLKVGDAIMYFDPSSPDIYPKKDFISKAVIIFRLRLDVKYYGLELQSYVNARAACMSNLALTCLISNSINQTTLNVTAGRAQQSLSETRATKNLQGKVMSYDANSIRLDVGKGLLYTVQTPRNVIDQYNQSTVYGLTSFDSIYAKTDPEDLKIKIGDSLDVYYLEAESESTRTLSWDQVLTVNLMVERTVKDLDVLQKY